MNTQLLRYLQLSLLILDIIILNVIVITSKALLSGRIDEEFSTHYFHFLIFANASWLILSWGGALYTANNISSFESFSKRTSRVYIIWLCSIMIYFFFYRQFELSRWFIISSLLVFGLGLAINRFLYLGLKEIFKNREHLTKKIIILGYNETAKKLAAYFERKSMNTKIVGFLEDAGNVRELTHYPILNSIKNTLAVSKEMQVTEIFSTIAPEQHDKIYELMQQAETECIRFRIIPDLTLFIRRQVHIEFLEDIPVISLRREPLEDVGNRVKKRALDIAVSCFVIVFILSWLVPVLALLIRLESKGPVFFGQLRSGKNNKSFKCWKFRSMKINKNANKIQATKNDSRFTKVGKFLRKTSLDEFPQFYNVLKGEMSLVGPRPHMLMHTETYSKVVNEYMIRQFLKPGVTGWAQINGFRGEIQNHDQLTKRVEHDIWYSENWSLWFDIRIMFLTIYNVLKGDENAY